MASVLIGIHAAVGELASFAFLWVAVELLNPSAPRIKRAQLVALIGVILFFAAWIIGGYYYVEFYGVDVKPVIKASSLDWAHKIFTETKEHVFLFLPFMAIAVWGLLVKYGNSLIEQNKIRIWLIVLSALILSIGLAMAGMGYIISASFRAASL